MIHLNPGEQIRLEVRKHWFALVSHIIGLVIMALLPIFLADAFLTFNVFSANTPITSLLVFAAGIWYLALTIALAIAWTNYYFDMGILTDQRLIYIDQVGLFRRDVAECQLRSIEDISVETKGFLATVLNFGNVHVQTAGEAREFIFELVPNPGGIKDAMSVALHNLSEPTVMNALNSPD